MVFTIECRGKASAKMLHNLALEYVRWLDTHGISVCCNRDHVFQAVRETSQQQPEVTSGLYPLIAVNKKYRASIIAAAESTRYALIDNNMITKEESDEMAEFSSALEHISRLPFGLTPSTWWKDEKEINGVLYE